MSRISNSIKNIKYAMLGQAMSIIINFLTRTIFTRVLSAEYLGVNGLFSNIISILSLAELGVGSAIIYSMYKPLAEKDVLKLKVLMNFYKKVYFTIGIFILVFGVGITPFLQTFIKEMPDIQNLNAIYILYVTNSAFTYFLSYKRSFLIADQKKYIDTFYEYTFLLIRNVFQIIVLLATKNFLLYLMIQIIITVLQNAIISAKTDRLYPFLREKIEVKMDKEDTALIVKNTKALLMHKIGGVLVLGTDNLVISKFVGIIEVGLYSNYLMIIAALNQVIGLVFQSLASSIGNLGVTEKGDKNIFIFKAIDLIGFWIVSFSSICLVILFNPFINLWLGINYMFPSSVVLLIVINFYFSGRRQSVLTFKEAFGLFWYDRYKPLFEAGINLIFSLILVKYFGIEGVIMGTIVSTLTICVTVEPYVLFKYGFKTSPKAYYFDYTFKAAITVIVGVITWGICTIFSDATFGSFFLRMVVCASIPNLIFVVIFWKTQEFQYLLMVVKNVIKKKNI